jgi:hypothetical protein
VAFRILWHEGWPYPVTGDPFGPEPHQGSWFIQTRDGIWHAVVRRRQGESLDGLWPDIEIAMRGWLTARFSAALLPIFQRDSLSQSLTLLQRGVIQRLTEAGFTALAEMAHDQWSRGKQIPVVDSLAIGEPSGALRADFVAANKQASPR